MKILKVRWKNFNSYGNIWNEIDLTKEKSLNLISGQNGSGKCVKKDTKIDIHFEDKKLESEFLEYTNLFDSTVFIIELYDFINEKNIDLTQHKISVKTRYGYQRINAIDITARNSKILRMNLKNGMFLEGSPDHKVFCNNSWVKLKNINPSDYVLTDVGLIGVSNVRTKPETEDLYDLEVDLVHEYYTNHIVSHNSSIREAITFALYGDVPNKKLTTLPNIINKNLLVELELLCGKDHIKIERGLSPAIFKVWINGDGEKIGDIANKKHVQKNLSKYIEIPPKIFRNIISLDINKFISFLKISPQDKREIIDDIFNLNDINKMFEMVKKEVKTNKDEIKEQESNINWCIERIQNINDQINTLLQDAENNKNIHEQDIEDSLLNFDAEIKENKLKIVEIEDKIKKLKSKIKDFERIQTKYKTIIQNINQQLLNLENEQCPVCSNDLKNEATEQLREKLKKEKEKKLDDINHLTNQLNVLDELGAKLRKALKECDLNIVDIQTKKQELKFKLKKIDSDSDLKIDLHKKNIEELSTEIEDKELKLVELREILDFNEKIFFVLGETGFKQVMIGNLLPTFNQQIENFRLILDIPYQIHFNNDFSVQLSVNNYEVDINSLSTGETKKLDLVIVFSLLMLIKLQFKHLNILFLDEIFSGLDLSSQNQVLDILKKICEKLCIHIFVINHSEMQLNVFDRIFHIIKKNNFSQIEVEQFECS